MLWESRSRNGLILASASDRFADPPHMLQRASRRGELVRLRQGVYALANDWEEATPRQQHVLRVKAVVAQAQHPVVVAGPSAAALWGFPTAATWPEEVTLLERRRSGGKSEPGVKRTSAGAAGAAIQTLDGVAVTSVARTALDVARGQEFSVAVALVDWSRWRKNDHATSVAELESQLHAARYRTGAVGLERAIEFSTSLSDSFYESRARACIELLGFEVPELQRTFTDSYGELHPDFYWPSVGVAAEFDGAVKYTDVRYTKGDPGRVFWEEKRREDRLRRLVSGFFRMIAADVDSPRRLERLLVEARVPRR